MDKRLEVLSEKIVNYSLEVKENDRVLITYQTKRPNELVKCLIKKIIEKGGIPFTKMLDSEISSLLTELTNDKRIEQLKKHSKFEVDNFDCFISIKYSTNDYENRKVDKEINQKIGLALMKIDEVRINDRKWVLLNYPSHLDAYKAKMKNDDFYDYAMNAMIFDYKSLEEKMIPLKKLMEKTDNVRIVGPNTDITFSIKGMPAIICCGKCNIPDGEIYTAPIKNSVNGVITYNTPSPYQGNVFNNISLTFEHGKIIDIKCDNDKDKIEDIFNTDEGARYIGEFALGLNPMIKNAMGDILFDEKIIGSLHFTPGKCYDDADNGNDSAIHWDLVLIQREDFGGGEIYFDHTLIRKYGKFVIDELKPLNFDIN